MQAVEAPYQGLNNLNTECKDDPDHYPGYKFHLDQEPDGWNDIFVHAGVPVVEFQPCYILMVHGMYWSLFPYFFRTI